MSSFPLQLNDYEIKLAMCFSLLFSGVLEAQAGGDRVRMGCGWFWGRGGNSRFLMVK